MFVSFDVRRRNEQPSLRDALKMTNLSLLQQCWANDPSCDFSPSVLGSQKPSYDAATEASFRVAAATASGRSEYLDDRDTENGFAFTKYSDYDTYEAAQFKARKVFGREVQQTHGWQDYIDDSPSFHDQYRRLLGIEGTGDDIHFINPAGRSKVRADGTLILVETTRATKNVQMESWPRRALCSLERSGICHSE